jgi:hypothetical protein
MDKINNQDVIIVKKDSDGVTRARFHCDGCECSHIIPVGNGQNDWHWNEDKVKPTFSPSILTQYPNWGAEGFVKRCHSFVEDGNIRYLSDCTHELAGKTVPLTLI